MVRAESYRIYAERGILAETSGVSLALLQITRLLELSQATWFVHGAADNIRVGRLKSRAKDNS